MPQRGLPASAKAIEVVRVAHRSEEFKGAIMRDIRGDLQERANVCEEQIRAALAYFEQRAQQLQREMDAENNRPEVRAGSDSQTDGIRERLDGQCGAAREQPSAASFAP